MKKVLYFMLAIASLAMFVHPPQKPIAKLPLIFGEGPNPMPPCPPACVR